MIEEIYIRDLGVIQEARLPFSAGLTVLTGETGAGKTMVLTALGLLLGERADTSSIRQGQDSTFVEGRWLLSQGGEIADRIREAGAEVEQGELIINRSIGHDGRSRASVSGRAVPVGLLNELGERLVVIHGQSDQIRLKSTTAQREALDQFAGEELRSQLADYQELFNTWKQKASRLQDIKNHLAERVREAQELRLGVEELELANVQPGEDVELADKAARLTHLEELRIAATAAHEALSSESIGEAMDVTGLLGVARRSLEQVSAHDSQLEKQAEALRNLGYQVSEVAADLAAYLASLEANSAAELEVVQERRALISALIRKYGPTLDDLLAYQSKASDRLLELDNSTEEIDRLEVEVVALQNDLISRAAAITGLRKAAAGQLASEVTGELAALAMGGATLVVSVEPLNELTTFGADNVSIMLSSYPGAEPRPLGKGASGGELSRIMLAIEVVLAKTEQAPTFIFDEVDAGVGGAAAIEVGRRLAMLAQQAQVIVVTHLAQVAAYANNHLRVLKSVDQSFTSTDVVRLDLNERVTELARMLGGLSDSDSAKAHAQELLHRAVSEFATE